MQKEVTVTFFAVRSSTKPESSAPILKIPPGMSTISEGQRLTVTANADKLLNSDIECN